MKSFNRYIREQRTLDPAELVMEGSLEKLSDLEWLNYNYCGSKNADSYGGKYITQMYGGKYELENIPDSSLSDYKDKLKQNKGIKGIRSKKFNLRNGIYHAISFEYNAANDQLRKEAIDSENAAEKKAAEKFRKAVESADTSKYSTDDKHIAKMKGYFNKHSDPERLIKSIKDDKKLVARWIAAIKIGWPEAVSVFGYEIEHKKLLTKAEIVAYSEKYGSDDEKVDDSDMKRVDKETKKLIDSWITKSVYKYFETLKDVEIKWVEFFKNAKTEAGKEAMRRNGRAWTEGFVVNVKKGDKEKKVTFDVVTNEGGGLYGYVLNYGGVVNLKKFKELFNNIINNL